MSNIINITCSTSKSRKFDGQKMLSDLGRPTRRGVKKCPNCGYLNGTRGYMCKNAICNMVFKDSDKHKLHLDSIRLETGTARQIYSVRVRDKGPDQRGFVQLPLYETGDKSLLSEALCFVDSCRRLFDNSILKCHENEVSNTSTICVHIESALKSLTSAIPLEFKHDLINNLSVEEDVKKRVCSLAKSTEGPVVQRVSKAVMAVKCAVTPTNPLGYLHLMLGCSKDDGLEEVDIFCCSCADNLLQTSKAVPSSVKAKCIHYYACICAFASDSKFSSKFAHIIHNEFDPIPFANYEFNLSNILDEECVPILDKNSILEFANADNHLENIEIEVLPTDFILDADKLDILNVPYTMIPEKQKVVKKLKRKQTVTVVKSYDMNFFDVLSFNEWLPSVTECINSIMSSGVESHILTFHIPNRFYELLRDRICAGPNLSCKSSKTQRTVPPVGSYNTSTWHICDTSQLALIFDTEFVHLVLANEYVQDASGRFVEASKKCPQLIIFLNVGKIDNNGNPVPFVIEWTEDLYKVSKFGELRLLFQYGKRILNNL